MGFCTRRYFLLTICLLQLVFVFERQVFEFLGYLWIPILVNFFEIIFVIFGFFGAYQYRPKYIISYSLWHLFWLGWNIFIICLYLDLGLLNHKENLVLKLDSDSESWWIKNGPGCKAELNTTNGVPKVENVTNCLVDYRYVEIFQAGMQALLALLGVITGTCLSRTFLEEDDSFNYMSGDGKGVQHLALQPMYVDIDRVPSYPALNSSLKSNHKTPASNHSSMSNNEPNHTEYASHKSRKNSKRMSLYSIEFSPRERQDDSDSNEYDNDNLHPQISPKPMTPRRVKRRSVMQRGTTSRHSTSSRRHNTARSSTRSSRRMAQNPVTRLMEQQQKLQQQQQQQQQQQHYDHPASPAMDGTLKYYTNSSNNNLMGPQPAWQNNGHTNPTYQQSSTQSLNEPDDFDELYNNRPASVRSSYSNFHGTRAINYAQQHYHSHATPQVPQKRMGNPNRQSMRSMAFLNNGPPAYSSQGHLGGLDSETTI